MKKTYIIPQLITVKMSFETMIAQSGVNAQGTSVGFSNESGDISDAAVKSSGNSVKWDDWE